MTADFGAILTSFCLPDGEFESVEGQTNLPHPKLQFEFN
jgi:hypothetical protein